MKTTFKSPHELTGAVGKILGPSEWVTVDQSRIDKFAEATGDKQWIHVDVERAKGGPFGATIAHGYLTLSMVSLFMPQLIEVQAVGMGINYGVDRVRFPSVVRSGSRIRGKGEITGVEPTNDGAIQSKIRITIEIEGGEKPVCVADTISRWYPAKS